MDAARLPFRDEFDVVGAFDVLEHIRDDRAVIARCWEACKPGGGLVETVPQHPRRWSGADDVARHERRYTRSQLLEKVTSAGFRIERVTRFVALLLLAMMAARMDDRGKRIADDPTTEFRLGRRLDAGLDRVMTLERSFIRRGVPFPAGGSLLLIARR